MNANQSLRHPLNITIFNAQAQSAFTGTSHSMTVNTLVYVSNEASQIKHARKP